MSESPCKITVRLQIVDVSISIKIISRQIAVDSSFFDCPGPASLAGADGEQPEVGGEGEKPADHPAH